MNKFKLAGAAVVVLMAVLVVSRHGFKVYAGAAKYTPPDNEDIRRARKDFPPGMIPTIYTKNDSYEKVVEFYKGFAKEYIMLGMPKGPDRRNLSRFIVVTSRHPVQHQCSPGDRPISIGRSVVQNANSGALA